MNYLTSLQVSEKLGITKRRVNDMCLHGELHGAIKDGNRWMIPEDSFEKVGSGKKEIKPLPIGVSDYINIVSNYYYVDKTLMIRDIIDERPAVSLFLRPRRFGKTLNMDMIRTFFGISDSGMDTSIYFDNTKIAGLGKKYMDYQGRFPVIYFTFKDMKYSTWDDMYANILDTIQREYNRVLLTIGERNFDEKNLSYIRSVIDGKLKNALWGGTLGRLTEILDEYYNVKPIVIIDEYDTPIQQGHLYGFYDEVIGFMRNFLSGGLKDNKHLTMAFLTGILRVAKESIFSGLNNLSVYSVIDRKYSSYFGFTEEEVKKILSDYGLSDKFAQAKEWYDGYHFGDCDIYNPWSVLSFVSEGGIPKTYWQSTGSNEVIGEIIGSGTAEFLEEMKGLLLGDARRAYIDTSVVYPEIGKNSYEIYSFLIMGGYLTTENSTALYDGNTMANVRIPNLEVMHIFEKEILQRSGGIVTGSDAIGFQLALESGDNTRMQTCLESFLVETISFHDASAEGFYHGLLLGLSAALGRVYQISSNREAGDGRYDICLIPRHKGRVAYIIEVKALNTKKKALSDSELDKQLSMLAQEAYDQIVDNKYAYGVPKGIKSYGIGVSFYKKRCRITGDKI